MKKYFSFLAIVFLAVSSVSLAQAPVSSTPMVTGPLEGNWEAIKDFGRKGFDELLIKGIEAVKQAFDWAISFWQKSWDKILEWWQTYLAEKFQAWWQETWQKIKSFLAERKIIFEQEFDKEGKEMKKDIKTEVPELSKSFWEKLKGLWQAE